MKQSLMLLLLVFILNLQATAQINYTAKFQKEVAAHPAEDTFRVNRLNEMTLGYDLSEDEKIKISTDALHISTKIGYESGKALALATLGMFQQQQGNVMQGLNMMTEAEAIADKIANPRLKPIVLLRKGVGLNASKSLQYFLEAEKTATQIGDKRLLSIFEAQIAQFYMINLSDYPKSLAYYLKASSTAEQVDDLATKIYVWRGLGALYTILADQDKALQYLQEASTANKLLGSNNIESLIQSSLGESYRLSGRYRQAIEAYKLATELDTSAYSLYIDNSNLADVYTRIDTLPQAFAYGFSSLNGAKKAGDTSTMAWVYGILSRASLKSNRADSAVYYAKLGLVYAQQSNSLEFLRDNNLALANAYAAKKDFGDAYQYHLQYITYRDSMFSGEIRNKTSLLAYNSQLSKKEVEIAALGQQKKDQQKILYSIAAVLLLILLSAVLLWRNNRQKQQANKVLEVTLNNLKSTQTQLIQSEKMASLGELTAGIAHEIQNPLNFVNNFSEVNTELIDEAGQEIDKGNISEAKIILIDIKENEQKINHHGKRADAIVKGMLQHSRSSSGTKEPTDINALCDEYLRLSYHGLRAKDKSFNTTMKTDFDTSLQKVNIIPQDIGRVVLNLLTNAFYVVNEKKKSGIENYEPTVSISTKKTNDKIEIRVSDNGNGIPESIKDKIFQPFFTTKPTGQGTGLGLSLSYDIIKAHGGEITVDTGEGKGSTFTIQLPIV